MRFYFFLPRVFGIRPGISLSPEDFASGRRRLSSYASGQNAPVTMEPSFIYVIGGDHGRSKIGISSNPNARMAQLSTASAFPLSFAYIGAAQSNNATNIEHEAHAILDRYRVNGEWFSCPTEMAIAAVHGAAAKVGEKLCWVDPSRVDEIVDLALAREGKVKPSNFKRRFGMAVLIVSLSFVLWGWVFVSLVRRGEESAHLPSSTSSWGEPQTTGR